MQSYITRVEAAIKALQQGKAIVLTDHPDRENEGDIIFPAEIVTPDIVNFMIRYCSGIICLSLLEDQLKKIGVSYMVNPFDNTSRLKTPFTVSIEAKEGITTGVSAHDRAKTILTAVNDHVVADDLLKPGHIFPLHANARGVLARNGHTEGSIDIVRLAGFKPAAILCEVMNPDGTMAKGEALTQFAAQHDLTMLSIDDVITYRLAKENLIIDETSAVLPLENYGEFNITVIKESLNHEEHVILTKEKITADPVLVRIHSSCCTGDIFGSRRCDCKQQLDYSLQCIAKEGGILIYLDQEGRGIGIFNKIKSYALQEQGLDTIEANQQLGFPPDSRQYYIAANYLRNKNISHIRLLTNNPSKINGLKKYGIANIIQQPIPVFCNEYNRKYLHTKKDKLNHLIDI